MRASARHVERTGTSEHLSGSLCTALSRCRCGDAAGGEPSPQKRRDLIVTASAQGFHSFFSESSEEIDSVGRTLNRGGLAKVRHELPARRVCSEKAPGDFEALCVRIGEIGCFVNCHHKPRSGWHSCQLYLEERLSQESRVVVGGDFNLLPHEVCLAGATRTEAPRGADGAHPAHAR